MGLTIDARASFAEEQLLQLARALVQDRQLLARLAKAQALAGQHGAPAHRPQLIGLVSILIVSQIALWLPRAIYGP